MNVQQAIESTRCLNAKEKATLAHCLISSLETKQDEGVEQAWGELAEKRFSDLITGKVEPVSWNDLKKEIQE
jgi:endonuclease YncB( thermonuclease family)